MLQDHAEAPRGMVFPGWLAPLDWLGSERAWRRITLALRALIPLAALFVGGIPTLVGAIAVQEGGRWAARRLSTDASFAPALFVAAFSVRAVLAAGLHAFLVARGGDGSIFQDDHTYDLVAQWMVRIIHGEGISIFVGHQHLLDNLYLYVVTGIYAVLGHAPLVPKLLNCAFAALSAVLMLEIARRTFNERAGRVAGVVATLLPTLVFWSVATLKEMLVLFAIMAALRALQALGEEHWRSSHLWNGVVALGPALYIVDSLRFASLLVLAALIPVLLIGRSVGRLRAIHWAILASVLVVGLVGAVALSRAAPAGSRLWLLSQPDELARTLSSRRAQEGVRARSALGTDVNPTFRDVLDLPGYREPEHFELGSTLLEPLGFALLAPAPWQIGSLREAAVGAEMLLWYVLLVGSVASALARPREPAFAVAVALYGIVTWLLLAFAEGNLGNLLRHRIMLTPPLVILGAAGLDWLMARTWARRVGSMPAIRETRRSIATAPRTAE